jgi:hypothetical protein
VFPKRTANVIVISSHAEISPSVHCASQLACVNRKSSEVLASPKRRARDDEPVCLCEDHDSKPMGVEIQVSGYNASNVAGPKTATVNTQVTSGEVSPAWPQAPVVVLFEFGFGPDLAHLYFSGRLITNPPFVVTSSGSKLSLSILFVSSSLLSASF